MSCCCFRMKSIKGLLPKNLKIRSSPNFYICNFRRKSTFTITTPIFYVNASPHIGHLYTTLLADAAARWQGLQGREVQLLTGTDEHGLKIQNAAKKNNVPVLQYCDEICSKYNDLFKAAGIEYTQFIRTTDQRHKDAVQHFWKRLSPHITKGFYTGWYCTNDEAFLNDDQVHEVQDSIGNSLMVSKESGQPCEMMEEENYIFPLDKFSQQVADYISSSAVFPQIFKSFLYQSLSNLGDLSVSRSSRRLSWGIPVPGDPSQTIYVWLDALVNYLTACGYPNEMENWPVSCHVIGKDILKFHAIYWPAFLIAADLPLPQSIFCHSHWVVDGRKMSKSVGNVIDPIPLIDKYTSDGMRYFLLREGVPDHDGNFSEGKMVDYLNAELCNTLGNLLSRVTAKTLNPSQIFPPLNSDIYESMATEEWKELLSDLQTLPERVSEHYNNYHFYKGVDEIMGQLRSTNGFVQLCRPWELGSQPDILNVILHLVMENLRVSAILLQPIVPNLSSTILDRLAIPQHGRTFSHILPLSRKNVSRQILPGAVLYKRIPVSRNRSISVEL